MIYRDYQQKFDDDISSKWDEGYLNVLGVMPCRSGKTVVIANIARRNVGVVFIMVHRRELIAQLSLTLAKFEIYHRIIAPNNIIKWIIQLHIRKTGKNYYDPSAKCVVSAVQTLLRRTAEYKTLTDQCTLWITDECHHILKKNQWGKVVALFSNAKGLGVTATPIRADGNGLGAHVDGVFNVMVLGPSARDLINLGHICEYRIISPPSDLILDDVPLTPSGDFSPKPLKEQVRKSQIIGDTVINYLKFASGKQGAVFTTDIETAGDICASFRNRGIKTEIITGTTPDRQRIEIFERFESRLITIIVSVDIMGEGIDIPAIEVGILARPTESFGLFTQQFFRPLTISPGKTHGIIIDQVGNVHRHRLPDVGRVWTLDRREKRSNTQDDVIPVRTCLNPECLSVYEAIYKSCPFCGTVHIPANRSKPEYVDGDLTEIDPHVLQMMRDEVIKVDTPKQSDNTLIGNSIAKNHRLRKESQSLLRESIRWWAGHHEKLNRDGSEIYKRFYFKFGYDVLSAQVLGKKDANELTIMINKDIDAMVNKG